MPTSSFGVPRLTSFATAILVAEGVSEQDAQVCAVRLLDADMRGQRAHGLARLAAYAKRIEAGGLDPRAVPSIVRETPASALVDGHNGLGPVVMTFATERAIAKARSAGLAWIGVRGSNHAGAGGAYVQLVVDAGLIGIFAAVANANQMAPWGGVDPLLGTNPIAIGIPAGDEPAAVLDMATTAVALGTVRQTLAAGRPIPPGWLIDQQGEPVTDPKLVAGATLAPIGGHKGFGLAVAIAALAGALNGARSGSEVVDHYADQTTPTNTGQLIIAVDPALFRPLAEFRAEMDLRLKEIRASRPREGGGPVRVPGDRSAMLRRAALDQGLTLGAPLLAELQALAQRLGVADRLADAG